MWSEVGSTTDRTVARHHLTDHSGRWTALLNEYIRVRTYRDQSPAGDSYVFKEGLLYPEDLELLQRETIEVPITWDGIEADAILRWRLTAQLVVSGDDAPTYSAEAAVTEVPGFASPGETFADFKWLVLMLTGCSIWELTQGG